VGIPSGLSWNHIAFHGPVSGDHILDNTGEHMADVRFSISGRRSVIEGIGRTFFTVFHALFENVIVFPELFYFFLPFYKVEVCSNFLIHSFSPFQNSKYFTKAFLFFPFKPEIYRKGFRPVTGRKPYCAVVIPPLTSYEAYAFICVPCNVGKPASPTWFRWQLRSDILWPLLVPASTSPGSLELWTGQILSPS